MAKRNQINITLDDLEMNNISEYCRFHGIAPQGLFKAGAQRLIDEDILERKADLMTMQAMSEVNNGLSEPIGDLLEMISEDRSLGEKMAKRVGHTAKKSS